MQIPYYEKNIIAEPKRDKDYDIWNLPKQVSLPNFCVYSSLPFEPV